MINLSIKINIKYEKNSFTTT